MLPSPTITVVHIARLDIGHHLGLRRAIPVGAAACTARIDNGGVIFRLNSFILHPCDRANDLLRWLDAQLTAKDATLAGYRLSDAVKLLDALPNAAWSAALRSLSGCGPQSVLDLSASNRGGRFLFFAQACAASRVTHANADPTERFAAWCRGDTHHIVDQTETDTIAAWRLVMRRLAATPDPLAARIATAIDTHFVAWLRETSRPAARLHVADLEAAAG